MGQKGTQVIGDEALGAIFIFVNRSHEGSLVEVRSGCGFVKRFCPEAIFTKMVFLFLGNKGSPAYGAKGRMNFFKIGKTGLAEGGTFALILHAFVAVVPKEFPANGTSRRVNNIYELAQEVHSFTIFSIFQSTRSLSRVPDFFSRYIRCPFSSPN
jgi:hypothetical protein